MKNLFFILLLVSCTIFSVNAQFIAQYNTSAGENVVFTAVISYNGHFLVAGSEGNKIVLCEIDLSGNLLSSQRITVEDESTLPVITSMTLGYFSNSTLVLCGYRLFDYATTSKAFVLYYDYLTATLNWIQVYDNPGSHFFKVIKKSKSPEYYQVVGETNHSGNGQEGILIDVNPGTGTFDFIINRNYGSGQETFYSITKRRIHESFAASAFNYTTGGPKNLRGGITTFENNGNYKYASSTLRSPADTARLIAIDITPLGNAVLTAYYGDGSGTAECKDLFLTKGGPGLWQRQYDFTNYGKDGTFSSVKGTYCLGSLYDAGQPDHAGNIFLMHIYQGGKVVWANSYPVELGDNLGKSDALMSYGFPAKLVVAGKIFNSQTNITDGVIMVVNASDGILTGCSVAEPVNSTVEDFFAQSLTLASVSNNDPVIEPATTLTTSDMSLQTKYCEMRMEEGTVSQSDANVFSIQVFPNPNDGNFTIHFAGNADEGYLLQIINCSGQIEKQESTPDQELQVDLKGLAEGIYFIRAVNLSSGQSAVQPFIKQ